jgi:hypothetical protein
MEANDHKQEMKGARTETKARDGEKTQTEPNQKLQAMPTNQESTILT